MSDVKISGYTASRQWWDFAFENSDKIQPGHSALYLFLVEISNRLGWVLFFSITPTECMTAIGCKSYNTFKKYELDLVEFGFIKIVQKGLNQYQSKIIALSNFDKALDRALDKANHRALDKALAEQLIEHLTKHLQSTPYIYKQETINKKQLTKEKDSEILFPEKEEKEIQKNFIDVEQQMLLDSRWHGDVTKMLRLDFKNLEVEEVKERLVYFLAEETLIADFKYRTLREVQSHFIKWFRKKEKEKISAKKENPPEKRTGAYKVIDTSKL